MISSGDLSQDDFEERIFENSEFFEVRCYGDLTHGESRVLRMQQWL